MYLLNFQGISDGSLVSNGVLIGIVPFDILSVREWPDIYTRIH